MRYKMNLKAMDLNRLELGDYDFITVIYNNHEDVKENASLKILHETEDLKKGEVRFSTLSLKPRQALVEVQLHPEANNREVIIQAKKAAGYMKEEKAQKVALIFNGDYPAIALEQFLKSFTLNQKQFDIYLSKQEQFGSHIDVVGANDSLIKAAQDRIEAVAFARTLVNEPANTLTPSELAYRAEKFSLENGVEVEILEQKEIEKLKMEAYLAVAKGSDEKPKLIVMRYMNNPNSDEVVALVGKGMTYDSGGYAIKPAGGMVTMHTDMGGSAAVIGAINLLAKREAKVNAIAIVPATENMISGHAYRNGDIISSMSGKSIEVVNTDAEGRLTLADAIWYAHDIEKATRIVDIATLTGAVIAALGEEITGVVSDDELFYNKLEKASKISGDKIWRLPCDNDLAKKNHSKRADIKNSGGRGAGTTTAALFLREFANNVPWTHLDIAGTAYKSATEFDPEGATGVGVELLADATEIFFEEHE